jgi:hypothetical protein
VGLEAKERAWRLQVEIAQSHTNACVAEHE